VGRLVAGGTIRDGEAVALGTLGLLDREAMRTPVARMSEGQRRRLHLALALAGRPHLIVLDEPTNHLSAALVDELTAALEATGAAVVVATHDRQMLRDLATWPRLDLTVGTTSEGGEDRTPHPAHHPSRSRQPGDQGGYRP
jgi:macrolide transport system ATP-binding/permease protein